MTKKLTLTTKITLATTLGFCAFIIGGMAFITKASLFPSVARAQSTSPETSFSLLLKTGDRESRMNTTDLNAATPLAIAHTLTADDWKCHVIPKNYIANSNVYFQTIGCVSNKYKFYFATTAACYANRQDTDTQRLGIGNIDSTTIQLSCATIFNDRPTQHL